MSLSGWLQRREKKRPFSSDDVALSPSDDAGIVGVVGSAAVANPGTDAVATVWGADAAAVDDPAPIATGSAAAATTVFKYELVSVVSRVAWETRENIDSAPVVVRVFISSSYYAFTSTLLFSPFSFIPLSLVNLQWQGRAMHRELPSRFHGEESQRDGQTRFVFRPVGIRSHPQCPVQFRVL